MKLFQQMLVAGASLSLIAPITAQASDLVNIEEMNSYARSKKKSLRFDNKTFANDVSDKTNFKGNINGLEVQQNKLEAGGFSDTTTMDGKAVFWLGAVDGGNEIGGSQSTQTGYTFTMNLNTSFTGDDNLYVRLKTGEQGDQWKNKVTYHIETKDNSDQFKVDKIWYTFPVGEKITAFVGPRIENYYMYITPSIYKPGALKSFKLGGNSNFGASTDVGVGVKYELDNGFGLATNLVDKGADSSKGVLSDTSIMKWDSQIAYTADRWHVSAFTSIARNWTSQSYNATTLGKQAARDSVGYALRGYWIPEETGTVIPEISAGYDTKSFGGVDFDGETTEASSAMIGFTWKDQFQPDDRIGLALTQPLKATEVRGSGEPNEGDPLVWEAYYSFRPNDSMEITPAVFGGTNALTDGDDDSFLGVLLTSKFKF